ncbi:MAG: hypothetical protein Q9160_000327 [Pyrenula sp. 1 TL-2023]
MATTPYTHVGGRKEEWHYPASSVAVVGMSCRFPGADTVQDLWDVIESGTSMHEELPPSRIDLGKFRRATQDVKAQQQKPYGNFLSDIKCFDNKFFNISRREAAAMDPQQRLLLEASYQAMDSAGYFNVALDDREDNVGVFIGAGLQDYAEHHWCGAPSAYASTGTLRAFLCGRISHYFGWCGPSYTVDTACSSSGVAIRQACKALENNECAIALAGGVNTISSPNTWLDLARAGFLSPTGPSKAFDAEADGYCRSEGVGLLVLKRLKDAQKAGDNILGVIIGAALNQSGKSDSITVPHSPTQTALYREILMQGGLDPEAVTYVEAHGTGTAKGDPIEASSVRKVFGGQNRLTPLSLGSVKANIGHTEPASGSASLIKALLMIQKGVIPVQTNFKALHPGIPALERDGIQINRKSERWCSSFRAVCVNNYGAAGSNVAFLVCQPPEMFHTDDNDIQTADSFPVILSGSSKSSLLENVKIFRSHLTSSFQKYRLCDIAYTLSHVRQRHGYVWTTSAASVQELSHSLITPSTINSASQTQSKRMVLVFPGQTSSKIGLPRDLYDAFPLLQSFIRECEEELKGLGLPSVLPCIFSAAPISDIVNLQCGMFVVQYAIARSWIDCGLFIEAIVGHSLGELTGLCISGVLCLRDALRLVSGRAKLMRERWGEEKGCMTSVSAGLEELESLLQEPLNNTDVEIACYNTSRNHVLVGSSNAVSEVEAMLHESKLATKRLDVTHGFHSKLTEPFLSELEALAGSLSFRGPAIPMEFATRDRCDAVSASTIRDHTRQPVHFSDAVRRIEKRLGSCIWLDAGFGSSMTKVVQKAVQNRENHKFLSFNAQDTSPTRSLSKVIEQLWQSGSTVRWWNFNPGHVKNLQNLTLLPAYQFDHQTAHWIDLVDHSFNSSEASLASSTTDPAVPKFLARTDGRMADGEATFAIDTKTSYYKFIVHGHTVMDSPLCPLSLYIEAVASALIEEINPDGQFSFVCDDLRIDAPLGISPDQKVFLELASEIQHRSMLFKVVSVREGTLSDSSQHVVHATGKARLVPISAKMSAAMALNERLVNTRKGQLESQSEREVLKKTLVYKLFSRIVIYSPSLQGIRCMEIFGNEATAEVDLTTSQAPERVDKQVCDPIAIDNFVQVAGLLLNSSVKCEPDSGYFAAGVENIEIANPTHLESSRRWQVYATFSDLNNNVTVGDVFVLNPNTNRLEIVITGIRFSKQPLNRLRQIVAANQPKSHKPRGQQQIPRPLKAGKVTTAETAYERTNLDPSAEARPRQSIMKHAEIDKHLSDLLSSFLGLGNQALNPKSTLPSLGVDSLGGSELCQDLEKTFNIDCKLTEISNLDYIGLVDFIQTKMAPEKAIKSFTQPLYNDQKVPENDLTSLDKTHFDRSKLMALLQDYAGLASDFDTSETLANLGIDSLSVSELQNDIQERFNVNSRITQLTLDTKVETIISSICSDYQQDRDNDQYRMSTSTSNSRGISPSGTESSESMSTTPVITPSSASSTYSNPATLSSDPATLGDQMQALRKASARNAEIASLNGFEGFWEVVRPRQDELVSKYLADALNLLVDLNSHKAGKTLPKINVLPQHGKLKDRIGDILVNLGILRKAAGGLVRTDRQPPSKSAQQILDQILHDFPQHASEHKLLASTGSRFAECLIGKVDPIDILFGSATAQRLMEDVYTDGPMFATLTSMLLDFLGTILSTDNGPVRILEIGAGLGGTTRKLAEFLAQRGRPCEYTFTDLSSSLVNKAKRKFANYDWMTFKVLNIQEPPQDFQNQYDIVIATNVIHATPDIIQSLRNIKCLLNKSGTAILSEITMTSNWYDLVFGLLDGWWNASDGREYPLLSDNEWKVKMKQAGFDAIATSKSDTLESSMQELIIGVVRDEHVRPITTGFTYSKLKSRSSVETIPFKKVDGLEIMADIYWPATSDMQKSLSIALIIHGGGHILLSRTAIRPRQTFFLLESGFLPISIDYRLAPESSILTGAMVDVRDAFAWIHSQLPTLARNRGHFIEDPADLVVIGYSTGGHLAMTTSWTVPEGLGLPPPKAILAFYPPTDYTSPHWKTPMRKGTPAPWTLRQLKDIALSPHPISSYHIPTSEGKTPGNGWLEPSDPRSNIVLHSLYHANTVPFLLNGGITIPKNADGDEASHRQPWPPESEVRAISPLVQACSSSSSHNPSSSSSSDSDPAQPRYATPTYIITTNGDTIAPPSQSTDLIETLRARGVRVGITVVENGADHTSFELFIGPGDQRWREWIEPGFEFLMGEVRGGKKRVEGGALKGGR